MLSGNISSSRELIALKTHRRYLFGNAKVVPDAHVREGIREPIVRYISLKEYILCVEFDSAVNVRSTKDASHRIVLYNLIVNGIRCSTYQGVSLLEGRENKSVVGGRVDRPKTFITSFMFIGKRLKYHCTANPAL